MSDLITDAMVEAAAEAMADDWNPERDPILSAMFRDYAASALEAVAPLIAAKALRDAAEVFGENQTIREGDAKEWLTARADRMEKP